MPAPIAIEVRDVYKTFRIPTNRATTLRSRVMHPLQRGDYRELPVLRGVSLSVERGEFFGVVGRNGSGKSTLLKLIASIYRADKGSIRIAGRLSPFIELGVGFHPELAAYDNVVLNGVMMGLTPREARRRFDDVMEFAELGEFKDLKLRNYSSGMRVRLAFAVMVQVDADIMLIDEVLAVGDAAFQHKCLDTFRDLQARGKTIILVTHSMPTVAEFCDRAVLIDDGLIDTSGDTDTVAARYNEINSERAANAASPHPGPQRQLTVRIRDTWVENEVGDHVTQLESGRPIRLCADIEAIEPLREAAMSYNISDERGTRLYAPPGSELPTLGPMEPGSRLLVKITLDNPFASGKYELVCAVREPGARGGERGLSNFHAVPLLVTGARSRGVLAGLEREVEVAPAREIEVIPR